MAFWGEVLSGAIKPEAISKALQPILKDAEANVAAAVSTGIQSGLDRLSGAKITITIDLPVAKAIPNKND